MMNSIAPFWDGNETWLVLGGTLLIAAFPVAYADAAAGLLCAADGHAVRAHLPRRRLRVPLPRAALSRRSGTGRSPAARRWPASARGSCWAASSTACPCSGGAFAGGTLDFLSALRRGQRARRRRRLLRCLGATWLILKTAGTTGEFGRRAARPALAVTLAFIALVSLWTPLAAPADRAALVQPARTSLFLWPVPFVDRARRLGDLAQHPQQI